MVLPGDITFVAARRTTQADRGWRLAVRVEEGLDLGVSGTSFDVLDDHEVESVGGRVREQVGALAFAGFRFPREVITVVVRW
jgi:hypothetical protein